MYAISFQCETKLLQLRFVIYKPMLELTKFKLISPVLPQNFIVKQYFWGDRIKLGLIGSTITRSTACWISGSDN
jgi:hypothetical protein